MTCISPNSELNALKLPFEAPDRQARSDDLKTLADDLEKRTNHYRSSNGNGAHFWLSRIMWEVQQSADSLSNESKMKLTRLLAKKGLTLFPDQLDNLYSSFLARAQDAAVADWGISPSSKKICKQCMSSWFDSYLESRNGQRRLRELRLKEKLTDARIADGDVTASMESRQRYLPRDQSAVPQGQRHVAPRR